MAFEGIKDKLREQWSDLSSKIQETSAYNSLREKFEEQSPTVQKAIVGGLAVLIALILLSFPYGYISQSQTYMEQFETNRALIQGLLRASRAAKEPSPLPPPTTPDALKGRVEAVLRDNRLVPEQIGATENLPDHPAKDLAPPAVQQSGIAVQVKKLNLDQIVALSHSLQNLGPGIKLVGFDILQSTGQDHYYDLVARVVSFSLPQITFDNEPDKPGKPGAKKPSKPANKPDQENIE